MYIYGRAGVSPPPLDFQVFSCLEGQRHVYVGSATHDMQKMQKTTPIAAEMQKNISGSYQTTSKTTSLCLGYTHNAVGSYLRRGV